MDTIVSGLLRAGVPAPVLDVTLPAWRDRQGQVHLDLLCPDRASGQPAGELDPVLAALPALARRCECTTRAARRGTAAPFLRGCATLAAARSLLSSPPAPTPMAAALLEDTARQLGGYLPDRDHPAFAAEAARTVATLRALGRELRAVAPAAPVAGGQGRHRYGEWLFVYWQRLAYVEVNPDEPAGPPALSDLRTLTGGVAPTLEVLTGTRDFSLDAAAPGGPGRVPLWDLFQRGAHAWEVLHVPWTAAAAVPRLPLHGADRSVDDPHIRASAPAEPDDTADTLLLALRLLHAKAHATGADAMTLARGVSAETP